MLSYLRRLNLWPRRGRVLFFLAVSSALAQSPLTKTIQVVSGLPATAVANWYFDASSCQSTGLGTYSITTPPAHGSVYFTEAITPLPPGTCNQISLPAAVADYTWTDAGSPPATDSFVLQYSTPDGQVSQTETISVVLNAVQPVASGHPVVFIPGITGSTLDVVDPTDPANDQELWPGLFANHFLLSLFPQDNPSPLIQAPDVVRNIGAFGLVLETVYQPIYDFFTAAGYREYQLPGDPAHTACDTSQIAADPSTNPNLFSFPYDWRIDIGQISQNLATYIACIQQFYPGGKVDLVTHSMGALVARRYILDYGSSSVNALVTLAPPFLGATKFLDVLQSGDFGITQQPVYSEIIQYLTGSFPAAHELMPSQDYFNLGGTPMSETGWDFNANGVSTETYTASEFEAAVDLNFAKSPCPGEFCPGDTAFTFHSYSNGGNNQDDWSADTTGVQYFNIAGFGSTGNQAFATTIGEVSTTYWTTCNTAAATCLTKPYFDLLYVAGDGTVPFLSASREGNGLDYNAPGTARAYIAIGSQYDHQSLIGDPAVQSTLLQFLQQADGAASPAFRPQSAGPKAIRPASTPVNVPASFVTVTQPYNYVKVNGADNVYLTDSLGNSTGPLPGTTFLYGSVPGVSQEVLGPRLNGFTIPTGSAYVLNLTTSSEPLAIDIRTGTGATTSSAVRFLDISAAPGLVAQLQIGPSEVGSLILNTSSTLAQAIPPSISLSGTAAQDTTPPTIAFSLSSNLLTITAQDAGGVKDIFYSLDGTNYAPYTAPISVDPAAGVTLESVYAYADDLAGNRSAAIYPLTPSTLAVSTGGVVNAASFAPGAPVAPGSIASAFGLDFGATAATTFLAVDDLQAFLFGIFPQQINFQVPWELAGLTQASVTVSKNSGMSSPVMVNLAPFAPGIFTTTASGAGQGAITIANSNQLAATPGSVPGAVTQAASSGEYLAIYCTGLGAVSNSPADGQPTPLSPFAETTTLPTVTIGGVNAVVSFSGLAPNFVGLYQVNVLIPAGVPPSAAVPVVLSIGGVSSNSVTIAIQ